MSDLFGTPGVITGAELSDCKRHRFKLWRIWDQNKPLVLWIMHNPSTADALQDDPTIRRCISFTKAWGYGGLYVGNLYPFRATDPKELLNKDLDLVMPLANMTHINEMTRRCELHVLAYGNPVIKDTTPEMFDDRWHYLKLTKDGNPGHPLYLKSDLKPIRINDGTHRQAESGH